MGKSSETPFKRRRLTRAQASGAKLDTIADQLGHVSTHTTRIYAWITDRMRESGKVS